MSKKLQPMPSHQNRFSTRVENYIKFRPGYPKELLTILKTDCGLTESSTIADVGSGTGILSELFLRNGNRVFGVEPNEPMRAAGERLLSSFAEFVSIEGSAEATTLDSKSVDFITAGQAFHWFDRDAAKTEFKRILKPKGWVVLVWNERLTESTAFLREYEKLLLQYGTDYQEIRHENVENEIAGFFSPQPFQLQNLPNLQRFDLEGLKGRVFSSSYVPEPGHPKFAPLESRLVEIFNIHNQGGEVAFEYVTKIFYGQLSE
ncbi:MAG TPA: class I SAM-dependent methyltransferase [Pyrinomonadaceae bacterium]|nr:class I SAM-dependent methyltransferase [Pyrinomonadaceae bacterium]